MDRINAIYRKYVRPVYKKYVWGYFKEREKKRVSAALKNKDFTIISSNCAGGVLYHDVDARFDSPTINMLIDKKEFCRFAANLPYYLDQELRFYKKEDCNSPCAYLGEGDQTITIEFTHYKTEEEARKKWEERKTRIHWDNLYIMTCDSDTTTLEDFKLLDTVKCKRKVVFLSKENSQIKDSFVLHGLRKEPTAENMQIIRNRITGLRYWETEFDYVEWLNGGSKLRR